MRNIRISDTTLAQAAESSDYSLSFKDKIDFAVQVDKLMIDVLEIEGISQVRLDTLRIKSIISAVKNAVVAVPVTCDSENIKAVGEAVKEAKKIRLQLRLPISSVQMEYLLHMKPDKLKGKVADAIKLCKEYTDDIEFAALDATRSDRQFMYEMIRIAIESGAGTITVCDGAGNMLPHEFELFIKELYDNVPELNNVVLAVSCSDKLSMAAACTMAAVSCGAGEIKASAYPVDGLSIRNIGKIISTRGENCGVSCRLRTVEIKRVLEKISGICEAVKSEYSPFDDGVRNDEYDVSEGIVLTSADDRESVIRAVKKIGYDLMDEDIDPVWEAFKVIAEKKEKVGHKELDAIVASTAMQVPSTYELDTYVINIGNQITCMAHIRLKKNGELCEGMALGDGPIDASFLAIEQITGHHYVLDDFQIRAVTEGHEAMGETIVKLQSDGKLYPGRGISTDIIGSSVLAYINALNRITYEENLE